MALSSRLTPAALLWYFSAVYTLCLTTGTRFDPYTRDASSIGTFLNITNAQASTRHLNEADITKSKKSIVVVGNGMSVIGSGLGETIDSYDEVARFNFFQTKGYEKDVGTKTSIWVVAQIKDPMDTPEDGRKENVKKIIVPFSYRGGCKRVDQACKIKSKEHIKMVEHKTKLLMEKYVEAGVSHKTLISTLEEIDVLYTDYNLYEKFPSSGLQMLTFFTTYFEVVSYIGFDFGQGSHDHYFEKKMKNETCHNMQDEARIITKMVQEGKLKPLGQPPKLDPNVELDKSIKDGYDPDCKIVCNYQTETCKKILGKGKKPPKKKKKGSGGGDKESASTDFDLTGGGGGIGK